MSISVIGPKPVTLPSSLGGDDAMFGLVLVCSTRGIPVKELGNGMVRLDGLSDRSLFTIELVSLLVSKSCEVEGYDAVFELDDIDAEVPETFPNRTYAELTDPDDPESETVTRAHTWATWGQGGGRVDLAPRDIDGTYYRTSQDGAKGGAPIPASAWVAASLAGLTVLAKMPVVESEVEV